MSDLARLPSYPSPTTLIARSGIQFLDFGFDVARLRALAITSEQRHALLPEVQTVAEQGWPALTCGNCCSRVRTWKSLVNAALSSQPSK